MFADLLIATVAAMLLLTPFAVLYRRAIHDFVSSNRSKKRRSTTQEIAAAYLRQRGSLEA